MRISRITVYRVDLPFVDGCYSFAKRKGVNVADATVVRVDTDQGIVGWGETCPLGAAYLPAYPEGIRTGIGVLSRHLLGLDPTRIGALNRVMDREMRGHSYVKSAIDVACHDILGKATGSPVHALLGGRQNESMPMYRSIAQGVAGEMTERVEHYRSLGYRHFQLKVGGETAEDIERIRAIVGSKQPGELLLCDANTGWRRDEAMRVANATRDLDYVFEQPCARYHDCLSVRRRTAHVFKLDESLETLDDVARAHGDDAMDVACVKVSKHGGLAKARLVRDCCAAFGIPMTVEDVWGGEIVTAALAHLAVSTPPEALLNTTDLHNYNTVHFAEGAPVAEDGHLHVGDEPGLGVTPDEDVLGEPVAAYG